ncbi:hypothetical protein BDW22DRAFT_1328265 [Trametopsis cervina]|nr:hypothetical protein BDW22DRAFT_1328265 [Trametopsis cervina]
MSAYGAISVSNRPTAALASTLWYCKTQAAAASKYVTMHHLTLETTSTLPGLVSFLHKVFADELERGMTYPQEILQGETYTQTMFEAYFFAADVLVGIVGSGDVAEGQIDGSVIEFGLEEASSGRAWDDCVAGVYYVKPNYPGRSSHICNAGFLVPPSQRAKGYGSILARSYLFYGPRLGYEASVFNLVYVNNTASVKLWEALGFTKAGRIPRAGRLRKADGDGEEYVDAWVVYGNFDKVN